MLKSVTKYPHNVYAYFKNALKHIVTMSAKITDSMYLLEIGYESYTMYVTT